MGPGGYFSLTLIALFAVAAADGQPKKRTPVDDWIDQAAGLPPEYKADVLLRLLEGGRIDAAARRMEVAERAFDAARSAPEPFPRVVVPLGFTDAPGSMSASASRLGVDQLSLSCRAIHAIAQTDPRRARELFAAVPFPMPKPANCRADTVPVVDPYFPLALELAERSFTPGKVKNGDSESFLVERFARVSTSSQAFAAAASLVSAKIPSGAFARAVTALAGSLTAIRSEDRAFAVLLGREGQRQVFAALLTRCQSGACEHHGLLDSVAGFYRTQLSAARCADTFENEDLRRQRSEALEPINRRLSDLVPTPSPLREPAADAVKLEPAASRRDFYNEIPAYRKLMDLSQQLNRTPSDEILEAAYNALDEWKQDSGLSARDYFLAKSEIYAGLVQKTQKSRALEAYVAFLSLSEAGRQDYSTEWLWRVSTLFGESGRLSKLNAEDLAAWKSRLLPELIRSRSATLNLYAQILR